jgi:hypothetical protein
MAEMNSIASKAMFSALTILVAVPKVWEVSGHKS